jgi:hypothetical protein
MSEVNQWVAMNQLILVEEWGQVEWTSLNIPDKSVGEEVGARRAYLLWTRERASDDE